MIELLGGILINPYVLLIGGLVLLALGGETLVRNATSAYPTSGVTNSLYELN